MKSELSLHEINAAIPRSVRPSDGMQKSLWFLFIMIGVLVLLMWGYAHFKVQETQRQKTLSRDGQETPARITKVNHSRHSDHIYYMFRFNGAAYQGNADSDESVWDAQVGKYLPIQFLPSDPSVNHPTPWVLWDLPDFIIIAVLLLSFGAMAKAAFWAYGERRLARFGWVTEGKVIACAPKGNFFRVDYEFFDEDHTLFDGANEYSEEYKTGSSIRVIYRRKNPKRNDTYPLSDYEDVLR